MPGPVRVPAFRPMRRPAAVLLAAGVTGFAALTTAVGAASGAGIDFLVLDGVTGMTFVVAGLAAAWLRPASPAGPLLLASGGLWFVGSYAATGRDVLTHLGFAFERYYDLALAVLLLRLSAPQGALQPRWLVAGLATAMAARTAVRLLLQDPVRMFPDCEGCPANPFALWPDWGLFQIGEVSTNAVLAFLFATVGIIAAVRLGRSSSLARRARWPVLVAGSLAMTGAMIDMAEYAWSTATGEVLINVDESLSVAYEWSLFGLRILVPIGFLLGTLRLRSAAGPLAPLTATLGRVGRAGADRSGIGGSGSALTDPAGLIGGATGRPAEGAAGGASDLRTVGDAVRGALGDRSLRLLRRGEDGGWLDEAGQAALEPATAPGRAATFIGAEPPLAALVHDPALTEQPELLAAVVAIVRLTFENEQLGRELRRQLQAVTESRARIVTAAEEERRRLERDLHDGAQQRLVGVTLALQSARAAADGDGRSPEVRDALAVAADELASAIRELRELARGIHPAILAEDGLGPAVAGLARRATLPVDARVTLEQRLPAVVESTAYFTIAEGLTNAQRYAGASRVTVDVGVRDDALEIQVRDDGAGGADPARGSGLRGLADRVTALGGQLAIDSPAGGGTTVRATIPLATPA